MQDEKLYCSCMEEIKARINLLVTFFNQGGSTGSEVTDIEFGCLQFRKTLELIALVFFQLFNDGYKRFSRIRASAVVKRQVTLTRWSLRLASQAATSARSVS